jgi:hypothetical protein
MKSDIIPHTNPGPSQINTIKMMRSLILVILAIGVLGMLGELLLMRHYRHDSQWIAVALTLLTGACATVLALLTGACATVLAFNPNARMLRAVQLALLLVVLGSAFGVLEHLKVNYEVAAATDPALNAVSLVWEAFKGRSPALAPGALAQLGLLGLLFTFRHPNLERS